MIHPTLSNGETFLIFEKDSPRSSWQTGSTGGTDLNVKQKKEEIQIQAESEQTSSATRHAREILTLE